MINFVCGLICYDVLSRNMSKNSIITITRSVEKFTLEFCSYSKPQNKIHEISKDKNWGVIAKGPEQWYKIGQVPNFILWMLYDFINVVVKITATHIEMKL